ncbi:MAG: Holliday junction resolvase RuvX [Anaerolineales bacterium]|nr:Holliday junction resolvase RuvX [Anaerolineae bacterium]PWB54915.1 MAG: Holliday junction resolvase RuvX [Anaerolineales bacterium]
MRIMAIDPGEKRIGVAISDPTGTIASSLTVLEHVARVIDAATIAELARQHEVKLIVIGKSTDGEGLPTPASRRADRLEQAIHQQCVIPTTSWDESFSTQEARQAQLEMKTPRKKRSGHLDQWAAVVILQSYLDSLENG